VPWATYVLTGADWPICLNQIAVADVVIHVVEEETKLNKSLYQRPILISRVAMPNLKKKLALPPHQQLVALTATRVGRTTTVKDNNTELKIKLVQLITNQLHSLILSRLRLMFLHLVSETMEADEEGGVGGTWVVIGERRREKGMWPRSENLEVLVSWVLEDMSVAGVDMVDEGAGLAEVVLVVVDMLFHLNDACGRLFQIASVLPRGRNN